MKILIPLLALVAWGCQKSNPYYCPGHLDNNCLLGDSGSGSATACAGPQDCKDQGKPVCDTAMTPAVCVQCTTSAATACMDTTPVCGSDDSCQACATHVQCGMPGACLPTGACGDDSNTAWVSGSGLDTNPCTKASPCLTITRALTTGLSYIKVSGTIVDNVTIARDVTILADPTAALTPKSLGALVTVQGSGVNVEIDDLTISGAAGMASGIGVLIPTGQAPSVTLNHVTVVGSANVGVLASGGALVMDRCNVHDNIYGGVDVSRASFAITNSFITKNNLSGMSAFGGVLIDQPVAGSAVLAFDTIADNQQGSGLTAGVTCSLVSGNLTFSNDIVWGNQSSQTTGSNCTYTYGDLGPGVTPTGSNLGGDPMFASASDFHITSGSAAKDAADPAATDPIDVDGHTRPVGPRRDIGAHELQ